MSVELKPFDADEKARYLFCKTSGPYRFAHVYLTRAELVELQAQIETILAMTTCRVCEGAGVTGMFPSQCGACGGSGVT